MAFTTNLSVAARSTGVRGGGREVDRWTTSASEVGSGVLMYGDQLAAERQLRRHRQQERLDEELARKLTLSDVDSGGGGLSRSHEEQERADRAYTRYVLVAPTTAHSHP